MYLVPIHVPVYLDGQRTFVTTEWKRSLILLRDSFEGRLGPIMVMAPSLPVSAVASQSLEEVSDADNGIRVRGSFDARCRARQYWMTHRSRWRRELREAVREARIVHGGLDDVFRPIAYEGCLEAFSQNKPVVFVRDVDQVRQMRELAAGRGPAARARAGLYGFAFDRCMRHGVRRAILTMLKGESLCDRYRRFAANLHEFEDTSYTTDEIVPRELVERRLATLGTGRALRFVYCGRIEGRKGVDHGIRIIAEAFRLGVRAEFDIIGDGAARAACEDLARRLGVSDRIRFLGRKSYGPALLRELAGYDALLFTPIAEDTPRMIFDAYAAGLPMVAYGIEYVKERAEKEHATAVLAPSDPVKGAGAIAELDRDRGRLRRMAGKAMEAASYHAADVWYARRARWTFEALARFESEGK